MKSIQKGQMSLKQLQIVVSSCKRNQVDQLNQIVVKGGEIFIL